MSGTNKWLVGCFYFLKLGFTPLLTLKYFYRLYFAAGSENLTRRPAEEARDNTESAEEKLDRCMLRPHGSDFFEL